ncbi:hypothetical protein CEXT_573741 [Caerostris extrusa]|uniref:Uncharacterized protein n=1 Tax=Caerostris extrusa TaxID=172846 RepID=A0AAV4YDM6_CAEEX|nr:hypothetical protein CEXT_573741 [Caerostris extrusa]
MKSWIVANGNCSDLCFPPPPRSDANIANETSKGVPNTDLFKTLVSFENQFESLNTNNNMTVNEDVTAPSPFKLTIIMVRTPENQRLISSFKEIHTFISLFLLKS